MFENYENALDFLKSNSHYRDISDFEAKDEKYIFYKGKKLLNLSSNNYLGLADNINVTKAFLEDTGDRYSFGSASARLLTGNLPVYKDLENLITDMYKSGGTLLFNSGYHANVGINSSLTSKGDVIFSDKLNHASIIDGMRLAESKFFRYPHNNMQALEKLLQRERANYKNAVIVSESVFSMDGDIADLKKLVELKNKYNCILVIDEAHAFGVFGKNGLGVGEEYDILDEIDLLIGTFGKAIGSMGAFVTGRRVLIDYLINKARSFIFSTALPPVNIAFSKWVIENKLLQTYQKRKQMLSLARKLGSESHIIPVIVGPNDKTVELCEHLYNNGYFTLPIRPPTVPEGTSRLRLSLTTEINEKDLETLCNIIGSIKMEIKNL
ncbi:TPA: 8-amino-7-oxononanoate synthase [Candidatus Scatousia excrementigallinarum]|uniref:8-amino-7-oxononanoate synthase n=1 Tax=Candidatus Scatousia excrementigallinarum TaxID=2840935 RepID=A0A9D1JN95_9BACT|nr:8-amino-7-oxononanoate synthase [Candidatus Scatousia excrementigallinarum]